MQEAGLAYMVRCKTGTVGESGGANGVTQPSEEASELDIAGWARIVYACTKVEKRIDRIRDRKMSGVRGGEAGS